MTLTEAMIKALRYIERSPGYSSVRFSSGEALRKRGLVDRETLYVIRREYANKNGVHPQFVSSDDEVIKWHSWWITRDGRAVLKDTDDNG